MGEAGLVSGNFSRHDSLSVAHLGPHLLTTSSATAQATCYAEAMLHAFSQSPQVAVLDEARETGDREWARIFREILQGQAVRTFRGAIVVRASQETCAIRRVCSEHWHVVGGQVWQIQLAGPGPGERDSDAEFTEEVNAICFDDVRSGSDVGDLPPPSVHGVVPLEDEAAEPAEVPSCQV